MTSISEKYVRRKISIGVAIGFLADVYHSRKITELLSFIIWELKYQLRLYKKNDFVKFSDARPLHFLDNINIFDLRSDTFFVEKCKNNWLKIGLNSTNIFYGCTYDKPSILMFSSEGKNLTACFEFDHSIESLFIDTSDNIFVCAGGKLFKSMPDKINFTMVLKFSSPTSYFRPESITENPRGDLFIGEYANNKIGKKWEFVGFIYHSINNGDTWTKIDFLRQQGINKHIHILKWSDRFKALIMTEGDNKKGIWVNKSLDKFNTSSANSKIGWRKINRLHIHKGGYTAITEINDRIIFGTDYYGGSNFLVFSTDLKLFDCKVMPDPYRRSMISRMVIRRGKDDIEEIWANLYFRDSKTVKSLLMFSIDCGNTWQRVIEYDATQHEIDVISHSANFKENVYISVQNRNKNIATTYCITNNGENCLYLN